MLIISGSIQRGRRGLYAFFYILILDSLPEKTLALPNRRTASTASTAPTASATLESPITRNKWNDGFSEGSDSGSSNRINYNYKERRRDNVSLEKQLTEEGDRDTLDDLFYGGGAMYERTNDATNESTTNNSINRERQENGSGIDSLDYFKYNQRPSSSSSSLSMRNTVANSIIHDSARTISQVLRGDVAGHVPADIFGQTIKEEIVECNRLFDTESVGGNEFVELGNNNNNVLPFQVDSNSNSDCSTFQNKLYGGAQYHRLLQSYHKLFLTQPIQLNNAHNTFHDEVQLLLHGISDTKHDGVDILRAVAILSSHKMSALSQEILNSLARRVEFVLGRRMWYVVEYTLIVRTLGLGLRYGSSSAHGQRGYYGRGFGDGVGNSLGRLYDRRSFGQGQYVRGGGESSVDSFTSNSSIGQTDMDGGDLAAGRHNTPLEYLEDLDEFEKEIILFVKEKYIKFVKEKVTLAYRLASSDIYALMKFVSWDLAFSNGRLGGGTMGAGATSSLSSSSLGQEDWEEEYFEDYDDYDGVEDEEEYGDLVGGVLDRGKYPPPLPQQVTMIDSETDQLLKLIVQAALQENVAYSSSTQSSHTKTSSAVSALVQHVTNRWRIEISRIVSTKFNSFCLVAFHDEFASFLRREMNEYLKGRGDD